MNDDLKRLALDLGINPDEGMGFADFEGQKRRSFICRSDAEWEVIIEEILEGAPISQVAKKQNISAQQIRNRLKKHNSLNGEN